MARARNIKPGFFQNADLVELSMEARLLFIGLWMLADRAGRLLDRPKQIKMDVFPADSLDCNALLDDLAGTGMLLRYEVDGKRYLQVVNFVKHQNPHRDEKASTIPDQYGNLAGKTPAPEKHGASTVQAQCPPDAPTVPAQVAPSADTVPLGLNPDPRILIPESPTHTVREQPPGEPAGSGSVCVFVCQKMQEVGVKDANASDAALAVLVGKGADVGMFVDAAVVALGKGKDFAYALGIVKNKMTAAAALEAAPLAVPVAAAPSVGKPDVSRVTVPMSPNADAELRRLAVDAAIPRNGPPPELRERAAQRKGAPVAVAA